MSDNNLETMSNPVRGGGKKKLFDIKLGVRLNFKHATLQGYHQCDTCAPLPPQSVKCYLVPLLHFEWGWRKKKDSGGGRGTKVGRWRERSGGDDGWLVLVAPFATALVLEIEKRLHSNNTTSN